MDDPIRIFVGCSANNEDLESQSVFEFTLRRYCSRPIDIVWMQLSRDPASPYYSNPGTDAGWRTTNWATPFSGLRWSIPAVCQFQGRGIYVDSDFIFKADIAEIWDQPIPEGKVVIAKGAGAPGRYCCSVWDAAAAGRAISVGLRLHPDATPATQLAALQRDPGSHDRLTRHFRAHQELIEPFANRDFNVLDYNLPADLSAPHVGAIHYTWMERQPQLRHAIPRLAAAGRQHWFDGRVEVDKQRPDLLELFDTELAAATEAGLPPSAYQHEPYGTYSIRGK